MSTDLILAPVLPLSLKDLILPDGTLAVSESALTAKTELLKEFALVAVPFQTAAERDHAIQLSSRIKGQADEAEKDRVAKKEGFLKIGAAIDLTKKIYVAELEQARLRLNGSIGAFNESLRLQAQREQEERDREARRIRQEAMEAQRKAQVEADRLRAEQEALALKQKQAQEAAEAKGKGLTPAQKRKQLEDELGAEEERQRAEDLAKKQQEDSDRALRQLESERLAAEERQRAEKASGGAQRMELDITVTDMKALYAAHPSCVKLTEDKAQIKYVINSSDDPNFQMPGVSYVRRATFATRGR